MSACRNRTYDHRLVQLVQRTRDIGLATRRGVPRSTARGWLRQDRGEVVTDPMLEETPAALYAPIVRLERRVRRLGAMLRVVLALLRILRPDLSRLRVPEGSDKLRLLRAIERARGVRGLQRMLVAIGLSASRLSAWRRAARGCELDGADSCPGFSPHALTQREIDAIEDMVTSPAYRHVPTARLALLAQRLGRVFASSSTWHRLVARFGWRRPRLRLHPAKPRSGVRAERPDALWHVDTTVIRLLDGTKAFAHAVIDNFSRRILAWRVNSRFDPGVTAELLVEAGAGRLDTAPEVMTDGGVENVNGTVDALIEQGALRRILALVEVCFSNSLIEISELRCTSSASRWVWSWLVLRHWIIHRWQESRCSAIVAVRPGDGDDRASFAVARVPRGRLGGSLAAAFPLTGDWVRVRVVPSRGASQQAWISPLRGPPPTIRVRAA